MRSCLTAAISSRRSAIRGGDVALARLEVGEPVRGLRRVGLGAARRADDLAVLVGDAAQELAALEQVGEALGAEDHRDEVGLRRPGRARRGARTRIRRASAAARAAARAARAGSAGRPGCGRAGALRAVEVGLDRRLALLQRADVGPAAGRSARCSGRSPRSGRARCPCGARSCPAWPRSCPGGRRASAGSSARRSSRAAARPHHEARARAEQAPAHAAAQAMVAAARQRLQRACEVS